MAPDTPISGSWRRYLWAWDRRQRDTLTFHIQAQLLGGEACAYGWPQEWMGHPEPHPPDWYFR